MSDFYKLKTKKNGKEYVLNACTQDTEQNITGTKNFTKLTVNSKNVVTSINGISPSEDGNVQLGTEKSTFNKVEYDTGYFSIGLAKTYSFDLTGSDLENVSKENVNIRLVAKVVTAGDGFEVGDIAQPSTEVDTASTVRGICPYIRGNTLHIYSGADVYFSIVNEIHHWLPKANVQIKAVLTAFIPDDGSILLTAEDQTNTSKLIGLPDGTLTWKDKNLVRSVNGVNADESGNVTLQGGSCIPDYSSGVNIQSYFTVKGGSWTAPCNGIIITTVKYPEGGLFISYREPNVHTNASADNWLIYNDSSSNSDDYQSAICIVEKGLTIYQASSTGCNKSNNSVIFYPFK